MPTYRLTKLAEVWLRLSPQSDFEPERPPMKVGQLWCEIVNVSGNERVVAMQAYGGSEWRITCRRPGFAIDSGAWLLCDGFRYEIRSVVESDDGLYLQLFGSRLPAVGGGTVTMR